MSTYDNAPPLEGWSLPPRCCGTWSSGLSCGICGNWLPIPPNVTLGDN